ncbi:FAD-binding protein, partial [Candidatus Peregrinibacteria bacterium]|nr:FAD-binding protein [Candidatus Peregrinibacteria bacterium]
MKNINKSNSARPELVEGYEQTPNLIQTSVLLKDKNWFKTGGPAKYYAEPATELEFQAALDFAKENKQEVFVLGKGANVLISDSGFDGLVIHPKLETIGIENETADSTIVKAGAGTDFPALIDWCLENNILGLEEFSGIPGTVGGAVFINLHYFQFLLNQFLIEAEVIEKSTGKILKVKNNWFNFGYNKSALADRKHYLLSATFKLKPATDIEVAYAKGRQTEIIRHRVTRYPYKGTCGSFFRNFHADEVNLIVNNKKA